MYGQFKSILGDYYDPSIFHSDIKNLSRKIGLYLIGSLTWARTRDKRINSPSLYQLSYQGIARDYKEI